MASCFIAIDKCTHENGCLQLLKGCVSRLMGGPPQPSSSSITCWSQQPARLASAQPCALSRCRSHLAGRLEHTSWGGEVNGRTGALPEHLLRAVMNPASGGGCELVDALMVSAQLQSTTHVRPAGRAGTLCVALCRLTGTGRCLICPPPLCFHHTYLDHLNALGSPQCTTLQGDSPTLPALTDALESDGTSPEPLASTQFHCNTLHHSEECRTTPRWSIICCYNAVGNQPAGPPFAFHSPDHHTANSTATRSPSAPSNLKSKRRPWIGARACKAVQSCAELTVVGVLGAAVELSAVAAPEGELLQSGYAHLARLLGPPKQELPAAGAAAAVATSRL